MGGHFTRATGSCTSGSPIRAYFAWLGITSGLQAGVIGASSTSGWLLLSLEGNLCVGGCMGIFGHHSMLENRFASRGCSLYRHATTNSDYNHWAAHTERIFGCWVWIIMHYTYRLILPAGAFTPLTTLGPSTIFAPDVFIHPPHLLDLHGTLDYYFISYTQSQLRYFTLHRGSAPHFIYVLSINPMFWICMGTQ